MADFVPVSKPRISETEKKFVEEALEDEWVSPAGDRVEEFENAFANRLGVGYAATTTTGTAALHLAVEALGLPENSVVISPSHTFASTAAAPVYSGYDVEFVDVDEDTFGLNPNRLEKRLSELEDEGRNIGAVIATHLFGMPCDIGEIREITDEYDAYLIEDAAESLGASYDGESVGTIGDVGMFSFYGNKNLTTGQGGMVVTDIPEIDRRVRRFRRFGVIPDHDYYYYHSHAAWNYQMTNIQAAIGLGQLAHLDDMLADREKVAERYRNGLEDVRVYPGEEPEGEAVSWLTVARFESYEQREKVAEALEENDIGSRPTFYPLPDQPPFPDAKATQKATAMALFDRCLCLPTYPDLADEYDKQKRVVETINGVIE